MSKPRIAREALPFSPVLAFVGLCALITLVATSMRRSLPLTNADPLLYGLISTQHLTVFYWGQDRLANVVPLLAWPVRDVSDNFFLQIAILGSSFFILLGCFSWYHLTRSVTKGNLSRATTILASGAISGALSIALLTPHGGYTFILEQQYAFSLLSFLMGIHAVTGHSPRRQAVGVCLVVASTLVNPSIVLLSPVGVVVRDEPGAVRRGAISLTTAAIGFVVASVASRLAFDGVTPADAYTEFSSATFRAGFRRVIEGIAESTQTKTTIVIGVASIGLLVLQRQRFTSQLRTAYLVTPGAALCWIALFSANRWVEWNAFLFRYFFPAYACGLFLLTGAVTECVIRVGESDVVLRATARRSLRITSAAAAIVIAVVSVARATRTEVPVLQQGDDGAAIVARYDVDLVVGDYWSVWPIVFVATDQGHDVFAVTQRAEALRSEARAAVAEGLEHAPTIRLLCVFRESDTCVAEAAAFTGRAWSIGSVASSNPLVLEVAVAP